MSVKPRRFAGVIGSIVATIMSNAFKAGLRRTVWHLFKHRLSVLRKNRRFLASLRRLLSSEPLTAHARACSSQSGASSRVRSEAL